MEENPLFCSAHYGRICGIELPLELSVSDCASVSCIPLHDQLHGNGSLLTLTLLYDSRPLKSS